MIMVHAKQLYQSSEAISLDSRLNLEIQMADF